MHNFKYDDGGRADAGYDGHASDCVTRAIAIATQRPYRAVYAEVNDACRTAEGANGNKKLGPGIGARRGVYTDTLHKYLNARGWRWVKKRALFTRDALPGGRIIVSMRRHVATVIDGVLHDTHECSRGGKRWMEGYWVKGEELPMPVETAEEKKQPHVDDVLLNALSDEDRRELQPLKLHRNEYLDIGVRGDNRFTLEVRLRNPKTQEPIGAGWPSWQATRFPRTFPEHYNRNPAEVGATDLSALRIHCKWPKGQLYFTSDEARMKYAYLLNRLRLQCMRTRMQAEFKLHKAVPKLPTEYTRHPSLPLGDYQETGLGMTLFQECSALFMDRGTGKSPVVIARVCTESKRKKDGMYRALIVCPNKARYNWQREFGRFTTVKGKVTVMRGDKLNRIRLLTHAVRSEEGCKFSVIVVGYDTFVNDVELHEKLPYDLVVCDESHYFKSRTTKRYAQLKRLRDTSRQRMILTGTPLANSICDVWSQFEFLGTGLSGFTTFDAFRKYHLRFEDNGDGSNGHGVQKLVGYAKIPLFQERLSRLSFAVTKDEAGLNLPDKVYDTEEVEMTELQNTCYKNLCEQLIVEFKRDLADPDYVTANHILTRLLRLTQICSGFVKYDARYDELGNLVSEARVEQIPGGNPKLEALRETLAEELEEDPKAKKIIWCTFVEDVEAVGRMLTEMGVKHGLLYKNVSDKEADRIEQAFNYDPEFRVIVANPKKAGDSLNFLGYHPDNDVGTYCDHEIYYSCNWSMIERSQSEDRAHRRGTKMPVRITDLIVPGTIDEEIRQRVAAKVETATSLTDVKDILRRVLHMEV